MPGFTMNQNKEKKALVINPWVTDFKLYDEWMHPVGLYFLMSLLRFNNWDVEYINCLERQGEIKPKRHNTADFPSRELMKPGLYNMIERKYKRYGISEENLMHRLATAARPDIICVGSGMTYWIDGLAGTVSTVRKIFPDIPLVIGGVAATLIPQILKKRIPEAEIFSGRLTDKNAFSHSMLNTLSLRGWKPELISALSLVPHLPHGPILTSLGCPFRCAYCASSRLQNKFQARPRALIVLEMKELIARFNITDFACYDDALLYRPEAHFIPLSREIAALDTPVRIHVPNGLNIRWITREILEHMKESGFVTLRFGYESGNTKYRKETSSKAGKKELAEKIHLITSAGFDAKDIGVYVMGGLPGQQVQEMLEELDFVSSLHVNVKPVFLSPVPGTPLFDHYAATFPRLHEDPLFHNDIFFITQLPGWSYSAVEEIKNAARSCNGTLS